MYKIKNNKILGINLSHKVNNLYAENNKTLMKEIKGMNMERYLVFIDWNT